MERRHEGELSRGQWAFAARHLPHVLQTFAHSLLGIAEQIAPATLSRPTGAMSQSRRAANDWFDSTLYSRLNDKQKGCSPDGEKIMRLHAQTATIENGFVFLPDEAPCLAD